MPPLTFLILVLHVLQSSWGRSEVAKTVPLIHGMKGNDRKTQTATATSSHISGPEILGEGSPCPIWHRTQEYRKILYQRVLVAFVHSTTV